MVIDMLHHAVKAFDGHLIDDINYVDEKEADLDYFNKLQRCFGNDHPFFLDLLEYLRM